MMRGFIVALSWLLAAAVGVWFVELAVAELNWLF